MDGVVVFALIITVGLLVFCLFLGCINYKIDKLKNEDKLNIEMIGSIISLEKAMKKLNEALKIHEHRLDHQRDDIYGIQRRLDILESGHPDSDIDCATLDDHDEVVEVWFNGKKYVPEDKRDENTSTLYADNKVVAETTRPEEKRCCATCKYYSPGVNHTCDMNPFKWVSSQNVACNKYEKTESGCYSATKGKVDCPYIAYKNIGGNGKTEQLLKRAERLDYAYSTGLISIATYRNMMEEFLQNDT